MNNSSSTALRKTAKIVEGHFRRGRNPVVSGPLCQINVQPEDKISAEVRGSGENRWVYFFQNGKKTWGCNPTYFAHHFFYLL